MIKFNIAEINLCTECEGPYKRIAIWFQGCDIHCEGCCNPQLQAISPKNIISLEELIVILKKSRDEFGTEGVTFLGGEPTLQLQLHCLAKEIQNIGMGVILFTGKLIENVDFKLIRECDIIIDGAFDIEKLDQKRNLVGSENQTIHYISKRYDNCHDWFDKKRAKIVKIEIGECLYISGDAI